jgi:hypothetical protein
VVLESCLAVLAWHGMRVSWKAWVLIALPADGHGVVRSAPASALQYPSRLQASGEHEQHFNHPDRVGLLLSRLLRRSTSSALGSQMDDTPGAFPNPLLPKRMRSLTITAAAAYIRRPDIRWLTRARSSSPTSLSSPRPRSAQGTRISPHSRTTEQHAAFASRRTSQPAAPTSPGCKSSAGF